MTQQVLISDHALYTAPTSSDAADCLVYEARYTFPAGITLASGDIIQLAKIPKLNAIVDASITISATLGSSSTVAVGTLNAAGTDVADLLIADATSAAAVANRRADTAAGLIAGPLSADTLVGCKVGTGGGAAATTGAKIYLRIKYRPRQAYEG